MAIEMTIPNITWNKRAIPEGQVEYDWVKETSEDIFKDKRIVLFALPGAFTPTQLQEGWEARLLALRADRSLHA